MRKATCLKWSVAKHGLIIADLDIILEKFFQLCLIHLVMSVSLPFFKKFFLFYFLFCFLFPAARHCFRIYIFLPVRKTIIFELAFAVSFPLLVLEECSGVKED